MTKKSNKNFSKLHSDTNSKLDILQVINIIRSRIMISMAVPLLCLILLGTCIYIFSYQKSTLQYNTFATKLLEKNVTCSHDFMQDIESSSINILSVDVLKNYFLGNTSNCGNVEQPFMQIINNNSAIKDGFFISAINNNHISTNKSIVFASDAYSRLKNSDDYTQISVNHSNVWLCNSDFLSSYYSDIHKKDSSVSSTLSFLREVQNTDNKTVGYLYLIVDPDKISSILTDYNTESCYMVLTGANDKEVALTKDLDKLNYQTIIVNTVSYDKVVNSTDDNGYFDINYNSKSYRLYYNNIADTGCTYILLIPSSTITYQADIVRHISIIFIVLTLFIIIIITNLLTRKINVSFRSILEDVVNISNGNFSEYFNYDKNNDFSELGQSINSLIKKEIELQEKLLRDDMTGLYDKDAFYEMLTKEIEYNQTHDSKKKLTLAIIDIDNFKKVNDTFGHAKGDVILCTLAEIMKKYSKRTDYPCRYGGEEFAVIFSDTGASDAKDVLDLMLSEFKSMSNNHLSRKLTFSCGICQCTTDIKSSKELFEKADQLLYYVKNHGKNKCITHIEE